MSFVAVSTVQFPVELKDDIHRLGLAMLPIARQQPGFIQVAFHQGLDASETMMYWEWQSRADHEACLKSPDWAALMADSGGLFARDGVTFSLRTFERLG